MWDSDLDTPQTLTVADQHGHAALRFPGGSDSDDYHWVYNRQDDDNWSWATSLANFIHVITNLNAAAMITLNYGTGSTNEAAAWVAYVNASTANTQSLGVDANGHQLANGGILGLIARGRAAGNGRRQKLPPHLAAGAAGFQVLGDWQRGLRLLGNRQQFLCPMILTPMRCGPGIYLVDESG